MSQYLNEIRHFRSYPRNMRVLLLTNMLYAFVLPVVELFVGTYILRNSSRLSFVVGYQLAVYTGIPMTDAYARGMYETSRKLSCP